MDEKPMDQRTGGAGGGDPRDERLRTLLAAAFPPEYPAREPSEVLRRRLLEVGQPQVTTAPRRMSLLAPLLSARALSRGLLAAAVGAAAVLLTLFLAGPSPAGSLERTLAAMARVRSAHFSGVFSGTVGPIGLGGRQDHQEMEVQW